MSEATSEFYNDLIRIDNLITEDSWDEIGQVLRNFSEGPLQTNQEVFIALSALRLTWLYREFIPTWKKSRDQVAAKLKEQGYVIEKSMFGLL